MIKRQNEHRIIAVGGQGREYSEHLPDNASFKHFKQSLSCLKGCLESEHTEKREVLKKEWTAHILRYKDEHSGFINQSAGVLEWADMCDFTLVETLISLLVQ